MSRVECQVRNCGTETIYSNRKTKAVNITIFVTLTAFVQNPIVGLR